MVECKEVKICYLNSLLLHVMVTGNCIVILITDQ